MFCPQCGTESSSGLQYCRQCGANLKVIGKAVTLSEAIARTDRGPLPKLKEMMKKLNMDEVSEEISTALDQMHQEMIKDSGALVAVKSFKKEKTPPTARERREKQITHRSEEHTSELQSRLHLVCRLLLEKKKQTQ